MSLTDSRRYVGLSFGLSISAPDFSDDLQRVSDDDANRLTFQEAGHVLLEGGRLILGHRWKRGGIMDHLASKARDLRAWRDASLPSPAVILNVIAWPDAPPEATDSAAQRLISGGILDVRQIPPAGIDVSNVDTKSDFGKFCRIRALTAMRKTLAELTDIRICLGGGANKPDRRLSGILEEAMLTVRAGKPLYLISAIGGVSRLIADVILQRRISEQDQQHFATPEPARALMEQFIAQHSYHSFEGPSILGDNQFDALRYFQSLDIADLAKAACLEHDEYINLLTTADVNRAFSLVTLGATRLQQKKLATSPPCE